MSYCFQVMVKVSDILVEHESCSKQHAVIQHRQLTTDQGFGTYVTTNKYMCIQ